MSDPRLAGLTTQDRALLFARLREKKKSTEGAPRPEPPLVPRSREAGPPPLSFAQQRLWFLDRLMPGNAAYNIPLALQIDGALDAGCLRRALAAVVARQESLRTTFRTAGAEPVQVIAPADAAACAVPLVDLAGLGTEAEPAVVRLYAEESLRAFDLEAGPLLRTTLLRLAPGRHVLLFNLHHIISDGWSNAVLVRELTTAYDGGTLPDLPVQYADFAVWQRRWLTGEVLERQLAFWRGRLAGMPSSLDVPADRPRPAVRSSRGAEESLHLGPDAVSGLKDLARRLGTTLFTVLLAAYQTLLSRWTEQEDLAVAAPMANRSRSAVAGLIGFFVNTLVLRGDLAGDPEFGELVERLRQTALDAFEHQDLPFEKLVEELKPPRDPSRTPLAQVQLVLQNTPTAALAVRELRIEQLPAEARTAKLDLSLSLGEEEGRLFGSFAYSTDLFDASTVRRFAGHFAALVAAAGADPGRRLSALPLLTPAEEGQVLREWSGFQSGAEAPSVPVLFARSAALYPDRPAVACGEEVLTYRELSRRVESLAQALRRRGVGPETRVALAAGRSPAMVVGLLAVLMAGGAYVPLDPALPAGRWADLLALAAPALVLAEESLLDRLPAGTETIPLEAAPVGVEAAPVLADVLPESAAYLLFTSGSTGEPKGVVVEHRQLSRYVQSVTGRLGLDLEESEGEPLHYALVSTFAADLGHTVLFPALCGGCCLHVLPAATALDPEAFAGYAGRHRLDVLKIVPSHLAGLLQAARPADVLPRRLLVLGGEAASWELIDQVAELAPECRIANHYGPTETTVGAVAQEILVIRSHRSHPRPRRPALGRPLDHAEAYVLDPRQRPAPPGVPGELWLGGEGLARGYLARPEQTAERFLPHPFSMSPGRRLYRTGDRARWLTDGMLEFLGRVDRQVKIRGHRIEPGEVEAVLSRHPAVRACAVLLRGESEGTASGLTACLVLREAGASAPPTQEIRLWLDGRLPAAAVPSAWVVLEALPLTANGKLDRRALEQIAVRMPRADGTAAGEAAPRTAVERQLAELWSELLGVERVGIGESFFDLGGHSLLLPRLQAGLRERMGRDVPLLKLFEHPTVESLAAWLEDGAEESLDSAASRDRVRRQRQGLEQQRQRLAQRRTP